MARRRGNVAAGLFGALAGLGAALPPVVCTGGGCASCLACVGVGGAAASVMMVGWVTRKLRGGGVYEETDPHDQTTRRESAPRFPVNSLQRRLKSATEAGTNDRLS